MDNLRALVGFTFYCGCEQFISIAIAQVLHLPMLWPVYVRERSSRLYNELPYFLATWSASTLYLILFEPIVYATVTFKYLNMEDSSLENFQSWLSIFMILAISGSTFGFLFGCFISDPLICMEAANCSLILVQFGGGAFVSYKGAENLLRAILNVISPFRYSAELMLTAILRENKDKDFMLDNLGYTARELCWQNLLIFFLTLLCIAYLGLKTRSIYL